MELIEDLDPEEARRLVDPALKLMMDAVHRYEGYVAQSTGDGSSRCSARRSRMRIIRNESSTCRPQDAGGPQALRRQVARARATAVIGSGGSQQRRSGGPIDPNRRRAYRIHPHRAFDQPGRAAADPRGAGLGGDRGKCAEIRRRLLPTQGARRQQDQGRQRAGQRLRGDRARAVAHAVATLGGTRADQVRRPRARDGGDKHAAEQAKAGHGQIVAAMAEAGVGKSRLFYEFKATSQAGWMVLETFSVSHGKARPTCR